MKLNLRWPFPQLRREHTEHMAIRSHVLIIITTLAPLSLFFALSYSQLSRVVLDGATTLAETLRDARAERIAVSVRNAFRAAESAAEYALDAGTLTGYNAPDTVKPLAELIEREQSLERVTLYNSFYEPLAAVARDGELSEVDLYEAVRLRIQSVEFDADPIITEMDIGDATSRLVMFSRISNGAGVRGYVSAVYEYRELARLAAAPDRVRVTVYNGRYQRIADSSEITEWKIVIDPLTERMLDGFTETLRIDSEVHAFGFIDLETTELFIDVATPLSIGAARLGSFVVTFVFFLLGASLWAVVVAWAHVRSIVRYGERILIRNRYTNDMRFFRRFRSNIESIRKRIAEVAELQAELEYLDDDISVIMDASPPGDSDDEK